MSVQLTRHRFTWDDYHAMATAGALKEDDRVELIDGEIVDMTPIGSRHAAVVDRLDLVRNELHVHRAPAPGGFDLVERHGPGASVEPIALPGLSVRVDKLLG